MPFLILTSSKFWGILLKIWNNFTVCSKIVFCKIAIPLSRHAKSKTFELHLVNIILIPRPNSNSNTYFHYINFCFVRWIKQRRNVKHPAEINICLFQPEQFYNSMVLCSFLETYSTNTHFPATYIMHPTELFPSCWAVGI